MTYSLITLCNPKIASNFGWLLGGRTLVKYFESDCLELVLKKGGEQVEDGHNLN